VAAMPLLSRVPAFGSLTTWEHDVVDGTVHGKVLRPSWTGKVEGAFTTAGIEFSNMFFRNHSDGQ